MRKWERQGVGGFTEELPALLVVLVALSLFIASAAQAQASWSSRQSALRSRERVEAFAGLVLADETMLWHGRLGMFDSARLEDANASLDFLAAHRASVVGFDYRVTVTDASGIPVWSCNTSAPPVSGDKVRASRPCNVVTSEGIAIPAMLHVEGWGLDS
jgi:hypothetical protein